MILQPIVEGPGDEKAIPILLRRIGTEFLNLPVITVAHPMLLHRNKMVKEEDVRRHLRIASRLPNADCILLFLDEDDDCCKQLNAQIKAWASAEGIAVPIEVIAIPREFESLFLTSIESLRGVRGIAPTATSPTNACTVRDAKGCISDLMEGSRKYSETSDQPALTAKVDLISVLENHPCFARLVAKLKRCHSTSSSRATA